MHAAGAGFLAVLGLLSPDEDLASALTKIAAVRAEGKGNDEAAKAWSVVVGKGTEALIPTLAAFKGADARAENWLRSAVDAIVENAQAKKQPIDLEKLNCFIVDKTAPGKGRALAYEWLTRLDLAKGAELGQQFGDDPVRELRRVAVAYHIGEIEKIQNAGRKNEAIEQYRLLLKSARDRDQVDAIVKHLKSLGVDTDTQALYGVVSRWVLITTFDNTGMKGYDVAYPPEKGVDLAAAIPGKGEKAVRFLTHTTDEPRGKIDFNKVLGKEMGAVAYAYAVVESATERPIELRVATNNAVKIFLNGQLLFFRNEYHHGMVMDQYVGRATLRAGKNEILLKICQNEQKEDWAQSWGFQARLCDHLGGAVPFANVTPEVKP